jgi:hypothetical protein
MCDKQEEAERMTDWRTPCATLAHHRKAEGSPLVLDYELIEVVNKIWSDEAIDCGQASKYI